LVNLGKVPKNSLNRNGESELDGLDRLDRTKGDGDGSSKFGARALSKFTRNPHVGSARDMLLGLKKTAANAELNLSIHAIDLTLADKA